MDCLLYTSGNVSEIKNNLMKRDGQEWDTAFINTIQDEEKKYAEFLYAKSVSYTHLSLMYLNPEAEDTHPLTTALSDTRKHHLQSWIF